MSALKSLKSFKGTRTFKNGSTASGAKRIKMGTSKQSSANTRYAKKSSGGIGTEIQQHGVGESASHFSMSQAKFTDKAGKTGGGFKSGWQQGVGNYKSSLGNNTVLGTMGKQALTGAAWGGAIGGTTNALQGGSFWDGATDGAFKGAVGYTGYKTAMAGTKATTRNPFGKGGIMQNGERMYNGANVSANGPVVAKSAQTMLRHQQSLKTNRVTGGN